MKKLILTRTTGRLALVLLMLVSMLTDVRAEAIEQTVTFDSSVWGTDNVSVSDGQYWWNGNVKLMVSAPQQSSNSITSSYYLDVMRSAKLTLTGQTGCYLTKFTITGSGDYELTTDTGTMTAVSGGYQWTGSANEVVITCGGDEYERENYIIQSISVTYEINLDDLATVTGTGTQYDFTSADALAGTSLHAKTITGGDVEMYLDGFQASTDPEIQQNMTTAGTFLHMPAGSRLWLQRSDNSSSVYVTKAVFTFVSGSPSISPDGGTYDSSTNTWTGKESQLIFSFNEDADIMLVESEAGSLFQVDITSYGRGTTTYDGTTIERGESTNNYMGTATTYMSGDQSMYLTFTPDARRYVYQATRIDGYVNETDITDEANAGSYTLSGLTDDCRIQVYYHLIYPNVTWGSNGNGSISFSGTGLDDQDEETFYDGEPVHEGNKTVGYPYGCTLTFTLLPDDGKELVMLMMNGQDVTDQVTENTFTVTLTQDIDIQAIFEQTAVPVAAPTLFRDGRLFALTTETENATIYYAVDYDMSQTAAPNFMVYSDADTHLLDGAANIWAYAIRDGYLDSETVVYNVTLEDMTARAPSDLTYMDGMVTLTVPDSCVVYYTTDGTIPSATNGTVYDNGIPVTSNVTVQAVSVRDFWFDSPVVEYVVSDFQVAPVSFVQDGYRVTLSTTTEGATIHYTISNSGEGEQTCPSGTALSMNGDCSITAYATKEGFSQSEETVYVFTAADVTVATPTFNQTDNLVTITTTTENTTIYYTLDGSEPTTLSNVYAEPGIVVNGNVTVKAFATRPSWFSSPVVTYNVTGFQVAPVTFAQNGNQITLSTTTEGATIHYTISNSGEGEQTCPSGTVLTMAGDCTIMAYATKDGYTQSEPTNFVFYAEGVTCGSPLLDRVEGTNVITAMTLTEGATIHYTTDGSEPTETSAIFPEGGLTVSHNQTIKAITLRDTYYPSQVSIFEVNWFQCEQPTFAWNGDALTISSTTVGEDNQNADILYTMVETSAAGTIVPDTMFYNGPITVTSDVTITAIARLDGYNDSQEAMLVYPYTAWKSLSDAIANAQNVYAQSANNSHVSAEQRSNLQTLTTQAEALYAERTADVDAINNMTSQLTIATSDIEALLETKDAYAVLSEDDTVLTFYYDNQKDARGGMSVGPFNDNSDQSWFNAAITTVVFDDSFANCTTLTSTAYWFNDCQSLQEITGLDKLNTANVTDMSYMFSGCSGLTSLDLSSFNTSNVTDMSYMFISCSRLSSLDLSSFNTANVTNMYAMFYGCSGLTSLDLSSFNTANVTNMSYMFYGCSGLTSLDVSNFNTANVTNMEAMFGDCSGLTSLDLSNFNTANVTNMESMFGSCDALTSLDLSSFNTANVTDMSYMFYNCSGLTSLDLSSFNTANVTDMGDMFYDCQSLTSLDLSSFNTANVTDMVDMFIGCSGLTSLDLSSFNTANVTDMADMFYGCQSLTSLDLSSFNTANVTHIYGMFSYCSGLKTIYAGSEWSTASVTYGESGTSMFRGCTSLVGGQGTVFDADHTDHEYARIDGQDGLPGYLSRVLSKGDANGDGEVNIADAVITVTNILGQPTDMYFHQDMADMNDDSEIDIFDVSMIVTAALNANGSSPAHGMISGIDNIAEEDVRLTKQNNRIFMGIDREGVFTAFQFDVTLPEGVELLDASLATGGTNHQLTFVKRGDNQYRVVGLSMTNEVFAASDGHLIQLQLSDSSAAGMAKVSNVLFINPVAKDATAIREHRSGEGDEDSIYNLKGQYLGKDRQKLGKGIYVINGKKVYIK